MSSNALKIKEHNTMLKKQYFDLSQDLNSERRKNKQLTEQVLTKMDQVSTEIQVCFNMLEHSQVDIELLKHVVIDLKLQLLKEKELYHEPLDIKLVALENMFKQELAKMREQLPHEVLTVRKLLSLKEKGQLDNRLFDATAEEFEDYIADQFQVTLLQARTIRLLFQEWK